MNESTLDLITGAIAITIFVGGILMMYTTIFTTKR